MFSPIVDISSFLAMSVLPLSLKILFSEKALCHAGIPYFCAESYIVTKDWLSLEIIFGHGFMALQVVLLSITGVTNSSGYLQN